MKILSMTATFGKLEHETLTLQPGLNIIHAPNEWGKSTWCEFLIAMLYGIDTSERTTKNHLAAKSHYEPWSGAPMSGRMDLSWNGKDITIERQSKGKTPFGIFRAYETHTGLDVPELTAENCGLTLLGVERSVFQRAGFLKLTDLPIDQDDALRRRLNALVTTGDESGTGDALQKRLKDLKNACRFNKKGLLPQAETQQDKLLSSLQDLEDLKVRQTQLRQQDAQLEEDLRNLKNHKQALDYQENLTYSQKLAAAQISRDTAAQELQRAEEACAGLPAPAEVQAQLGALRQLLDAREKLRLRAQTLPSAPANPIDPEVFRGLTPEQAMDMAQKDAETAQLLSKRTAGFPFMGLLLAVLGAAALAIPNLWARIGGCVLAVAGIILQTAQLSRRKHLQQELTFLLAKYRGTAPTQWPVDAARYAADRNTYNAQLSARQQDLEILNRQLEENSRAISDLTGSQGPVQFETLCIQVQDHHRQAEDARQKYRLADDLYQALSSSHKAVKPAAFADTLTLSPAETDRAITDVTLQQQRLRQMIGSCSGQMLALGDEATLRQELEQVERRISKLEDTYAALEIAQSALTAATAELQRRFAPRISQRAQELFSRMTGSRYDRLILDSDFIVHTGAEAEDTLHTPLWRSDGTADQLYLALRLAVAEELTPQAPLILDDALVRFDDTRLAVALNILKESAQTKQVLLFTCQSRESTLTN